MLYFCKFFRPVLAIFLDYFIDYFIKIARAGEKTGKTADDVVAQAGFSLCPPNFQPCKVRKSTALSRASSAELSGSSRRMVGLSLKDSVAVCLSSFILS